jgi:hypothetical protein
VKVEEQTELLAHWIFQCDYDRIPDQAPDPQPDSACRIVMSLEGQHRTRVPRSTRLNAKIDRGNVVRTAEVLGIPQPTQYDLTRRLGSTSDLSCLLPPPLIVEVPQS